MIDDGEVTVRASLAASRYLNAYESSEQPAPGVNTAGRSGPVARCDLAVTSVNPDESTCTLLIKTGTIKGERLGSPCSRGVGVQ